MTNNKGAEENSNKEEQIALQSPPGYRNPQRTTETANNTTAQRRDTHHQLPAVSSGSKC